MTPKIKISPEKRVEIVTYIKFGRMSDSELALLSNLLPFRSGLSITLGKDLTDHLTDVTGLNNAAISTTIYRLGKRGVIKKSGRTITFHPIYTVLDSTDLLLSFVAP